jgi:hypothetical protein
MKQSKNKLKIPPQQSTETCGNKCNESESNTRQKSEFDFQQDNITSPLTEGGFKFKTINTAVSTIKCIDVSDMTVNQVYQNYAELCENKLEYMVGNGRVYLVLSEVIKRSK